jgi:soluble lytic murein transglycosylase-like protein
VLPCAHASDIYACRREGSTVVLTNLPLDGCQAELVAQGGPVVLALPPVRPFHAQVKLVADEFGLDAALIDAVISVESGYTPHAVSPKGAVGLMQLMPQTARRFGVSDVRDPGQNIRGGARYLRYLLDTFGGDLELALAAYNAGEGSVLRHGMRIPPFAETIDYVRKVRARYAPEGFPPPGARLR